MKKLIVIGGGAAGLVCAGYAAQGGCDVTILDKNKKPARKVMITGKGRCNVTNNCTPDEFLKNVRTNGRFLYSAANAFTTQDAMELFERLGVPLKTERGNRVFPVSDQAVDIVDALTRFAGDARFLPESPATAIETRDGRVCGVQLASGKTLPADAVLLATGGCSYPLTGSDGSGWKIAAALGHTILPARASLVPIICRERWCAELMGLSLKNVTLTLHGPKGKPVWQELGEMLFTHFGVSGPLVLSASSYMKDAPDKYRLTIDLKPGLTEQQLDARLLRDFAAFQNRDFANALEKLLPRTLIPVAVQLSGISGETKVHSITKEQRRIFAALIKALPLTVKGLRPVDEAVVTAGGVSVKEIVPGTMESKLVENLYFAGEAVDLDAFTGGYNLQIAWSTAYLAARAILEKEEN